MFEIVNDEWINNLIINRKYYQGFAYKGDDAMNNNYETELEDLKNVYENTVREVKSRFEGKLMILVSIMKEFISLYENKKTYESKLEILGCKLNSEDCDSCKWDEDRNELEDEDDDE